MSSVGVYWNLMFVQSLSMSIICSKFVHNLSNQGDRPMHIGQSLDKHWIWTNCGQNLEFISFCPLHRTHPTNQTVDKLWIGTNSGTNSGQSLDFISCSPRPITRPRPIVQSLSMSNVCPEFVPIQSLFKVCPMVIGYLSIFNVCQEIVQCVWAHPLDCTISGQTFDMGKLWTNIWFH